MEKREIYADFNDIAEDSSLPLTCEGSRASIAALSPPPSVGEEVWLSDGELRACALLALREDCFWEAHSKWEFVSAKREE